MLRSMVLTVTLGLAATAFAAAGGGRPAPTLDQLRARATRVLAKPGARKAPLLRTLAHDLHAAGSAAEAARIKKAGFEVFGVMGPSREVQALVDDLESLADDVDRAAPPGFEIFGAR